MENQFRTDCALHPGPALAGGGLGPDTTQTATELVVAAAAELVVSNMDYHFY